MNNSILFFSEVRRYDDVRKESFRYLRSLMIRLRPFSWLNGMNVDTFNELNSVSIGVTLTTIAMTLVGLFAMMVALILYIMGKQVEQIQSQYGLTNYDDKIV